MCSAPTISCDENVILIFGHQISTSGRWPSIVLAPDVEGVHDEGLPRPVGDGVTLGELIDGSVGSPTRIRSIAARVNPARSASGTR
jgi:hypothetical protein